MQIIIKITEILLYAYCSSGTASSAFPVLLNSYNNPLVIDTIGGGTTIIPILQIRKQVTETLNNLPR